MVYLSSNGEIIGQFEEQAVPGLIADGKIPPDAFFWREGMAEWRPVAGLPQPDPEQLEGAPKAAAAIELKPVVALPTNGPKSAVELPKSIQPVARKPFVARRGPGGAAPSGAAPIARAAAGVTAKAVAPNPAPQAAGSQPAAMKPMKLEPVAAPVGVSGAPKKRRGWLLWLAGFLILAAAAGGGVWWWIANAEPPVIPGSVVLAGDETGPVEVRVFRRAELAGPWRETLAAADTRSAELDGLLSEAQTRLREKSVLRDEAAGVLKVGEEYNMPDVEELRADRDAKQAEVEAVQAEVDTFQADKSALLTFEGLLEKTPPPLSTVVADAGGVFALPPPEEDVVLLATTTSEVEGKRSARAWLEVLELPPEGEAPGPVRFSETNRLGLEEIRRFVSADQS